MKWNRLFYYIMGIITVYFGTALVVKASLGAGFWTALFVGFSERFGMSAGFWFSITQLVVIFVNAWLKKRGSGSSCFYSYRVGKSDSGLLAHRCDGKLGFQHACAMDENPDLHRRAHHSYLWPVALYPDWIPTGASR
ncbi:hypothetical protein [Halobacillus litoralis]|uniref:hypothetical protein n=1 Tax=Halobacillus litoralis TaxID=45668 RepID=UPI001CD39E2B|nr:hypothetical protein [Halobacillus litoralis]MCA1023536.1 hypothetical protein [Halobacillus litoralis]